jgi:hypothetical protein
MRKVGVKRSQVLKFSNAKINYSPSSSMRARPNFRGLSSRSTSCLSVDAAASVSSVVEAKVNRFLRTHPEGLIGAKASVDGAVAAKMSRVANFSCRVGMVADVQCVLCFYDTSSVV